MPPSCQGRRRVTATRLLCLLLAVASTATGAAYKPIIVVHGLFEGAGDFGRLRRFIEDAHPRTEVRVLELFDGSASLWPLWRQVEGFRQAALPIMRNASDGVHLLCYSQGGLICRGLVSTLREHNVHTLVSLAAPQAGQYGDADADSLAARAFFFVFPRGFVRRHLHRLCYTRLGQKVSVCNYWKDPHRYEAYAAASDYLALLDGERPHAEADAWRENFLKVRKLVLIGGPDDGVVAPWQSSLFGFYADGQSEETGSVEEMRRGRAYATDAFGLRTLEERGGLVVCSVAGVKHAAWHHDQEVFRTCMEEWLV